MGRVIRSLLVLDALPYPPCGGQQLRYRQAIEALLPLGPMTLLLLDAAARAQGGAAGIPPVVRLDPEVARSWHYRWVRLLGPWAKRVWRAKLRQRHLTRLHAEIAALLRRVEPSVVLVESAELMAYLPPLTAPGRRVVYDAHNVERLLWDELLPLRGRLGDAPAKPGFGQRIVAGEAALLRCADQVWACSEKDARLFAEAYPPPLPSFHVVPNTVDTEAFAGAAPPRPAGAPGGAPPHP